MLIDAVKNLPITSVLQEADGNWRFDWDSTGADNYRVVESGRLVAVVSTNSYTSENYDPAPPALEVADFTSQCVSEAHLPRAILQWYRVPNASHYEVEYQDGSTWNNVGTVPADGRTVKTFISGDLEPGREHAFRITSVNENGGTSTSVAFTRFIETPPQPPSVTVTYSYVAPDATFTVEAV